MALQSQQRTRSPQPSQREPGLVPSLGPEVDAEARRRYKIRHIVPEKLVQVWHNLLRTSDPPQPQPQNQSIAPAVGSGQQTLSLTTTTFSPSTTAAPAIIQGPSITRQVVDHELIPTTNGISVERPDARSKGLDRWVTECISHFLTRHPQKQQVRFSTFLAPYEADELKDARFGKQSYRAICLNSCVEGRLKNALQREMNNLMEGRDNAERYEVKVSSAVRLEMKGGSGDGMDLLQGSQPVIHVALPASRDTLCAARITVSLNHDRMTHNPLIWTCGGLISVGDCIYALTVSHPLEPQGETEDKTQSDVRSLTQNLRANIWSNMGRVALRDSSQESQLSEDLNEPDGDWMLVRVQKALQLPNIALPHQQYDGPRYIRDWSPLLGSSTERSCLLLTSQAAVPGKTVEGTACLVFGHKRYRTIQVRIEEPLALGDSGSWAVEPDSHTIIGVVIAGADSLLDGRSGPVAFVLLMADIYTALAQAIPHAEPRVLSSTENAILQYRQIRPGDDTLPGLGSLYAADIVNRFHQSIGEMNPPHLILDDMSSTNLDLRPFLVLGQVFPCDEQLRKRLHTISPMRWQLRIRGFSRRVIDIWIQLLELERGENFIVLLKSLVQPRRQFWTNLQDVKRAISDHAERYWVFPDAQLLRTGTILPLSQATSWSLPEIGRLGTSQVATEIIRDLLNYSDLPQSARPGFGLIKDLARIATAIPPLFRRRVWDHETLTNTTFACILAKASYAERHGCCFVYQGPFAVGIRSFLSCASRARRISAWHGGDKFFYEANVEELRTEHGTPLAPCLFVGEGQGQDFLTTGKLTRCPELYEHLYVGAKIDSSHDVIATSDTMPHPPKPFAKDRRFLQ